MNISKHGPKVFDITERRRDATELVRPGPRDDGTISPEEPGATPEQGEGYGREARR